MLGFLFQLQQDRTAIQKNQLRPKHTQNPEVSPNPPEHSTVKATYNCHQEKPLYF